MTEVVLPGAGPLGGLPPALDTRVLARIRAGYPPQSAEHPRRATWRRIVVPGSVLAVLDAVGSVLAFASGHPVLGSVALALFVLLVLITLNGVRFVRADPLRLSADERAEVSLACGWSSRYGGGPEVTAGATAAGRIVACPAWWSPLLDGHRAALDLRRWLDALEITARDHAPVARERAAALGEYAEGLEAMVARHGAGEDVAAAPADLERLLVAIGASDTLSP